MNNLAAKPKVAHGRPRGSETVNRIIEAAESLYGTYGIDAVSMRQLMQEAGVSNKSAISYHFGDQESLVRAVWERRLPALEKSRSRMLAKAIQYGKDTDPFTIVEILYLPSYEPVDADGFHRYAAFFYHAMRWPVGLNMRSAFMTITPSSVTAMALLQQQCSHLEPELFHWRLASVSGQFFRQVFERDCAIVAGQQVMAEETFLAESFLMATSSIMADPADPRQLLSNIDRP